MAGTTWNQLKLRYQAPVFMAEESLYVLRMSDNWEQVPRKSKSKVEENLIIYGRHELSSVDEVKDEKCERCSSSGRGRKCI
jgi:hypothetical protein